MDADKGRNSLQFSTAYACSNLLAIDLVRVYLWNGYCLSKCSLFTINVNINRPG